MSRPSISSNMGGFDWIDERLMGGCWCSGQVSAGEFSVEAALFAENFHCDAVATEPSRMRIYPKTAVLTALHTDPSSALQFLKLMAHQVIEARQRLELMKVSSVKDRVMLIFTWRRTGR